MITLQQTGQNVDRSTTLRNELLTNPNVIAAGTSTVRLGQQLGRTQIYPEGTSNETNIITSVMAVDESFLPTMNMSILAGRTFSLEFNDSLGMIINEEMMRLLKWDEAVGRKISLQSGPNPTDQTAYTIVGVVKDFHFATIRAQEGSGEHTFNNFVWDMKWLKLIGVHGKARSGKDTVARILGDEHGFVRTAFADPLKAASAVLFGWPVEMAFSDEIKGYKSPLWDITGRTAFQRLGDAMKIGFGTDFWIKRWACEYARLKDKHSIVVADVRTNAEADMQSGD